MQVEVRVGTFHQNVRIHIPIVIGSVPIYQNPGSEPNSVPSFHPGGLAYPALPSEAVLPSAPLLVQPPNPGVIGFAVAPS